MTADGDGRTAFSDRNAEVLEVRAMAPSVATGVDA
jgi:hypothetical protein